MRIINPIGFHEDYRGVFLIDKKTLDFIKVPLEIYERWKKIVEDRMDGNKK
jgi:hypothetical protein